MDRLTARERLLIAYSFSLTAYFAVGYCWARRIAQRILDGGG